MEKKRYEGPWTLILLQEGWRQIYVYTERDTIQIMNIFLQRGVSDS